MGFVPSFAAEIERFNRAYIAQRVRSTRARTRCGLMLLLVVA